MRHLYPRGPRVAEDVLLAIVLVALLVLRPHGALAIALGVAIPVVLVWGVITLHYPSAVDLDDEGITFHRYGRAHHFAWTQIEAVCVRRFLVRDRVLVRIVPSPPWRGRYWILDRMEGFDALVKRLEASNRKT